MNAKSIFNQVILLLLVGLFAFQLGTKGIPWDGISIPDIGPNPDQRMVVVVAETSGRTPEQAQLLNELSLHDWGKDLFRSYDPDEKEGKEFSSFQSPPSLLIFELKDDKLTKLLHAGPLPASDTEVYAKNKEFGGE